MGGATNRTWHSAKRKGEFEKKSCLLYISVIDIRKDFKPSHNNLDISIYISNVFFVMKLTDL